MGTWAVDTPKTKVVAASGGLGTELAEAEAKLYEYIEALEKQIERLDKERASRGDGKE